MICAECGKLFDREFSREKYCNTCKPVALKRASRITSERYRAKKISDVDYVLHERERRKKYRKQSRAGSFRTLRANRRFFGSIAATEIIKETT